MTADRLLLAAVIPASPSELLELVDLFTVHRGFCAGCGVPWPTLAEQLDDLTIVRTALAQIRAQRRERMTWDDRDRGRATARPRAA